MQAKPFTGLRQVHRGSSFWRGLLVLQDLLDGKDCIAADHGRGVVRRLPQSRDSRHCLAAVPAQSPRRESSNDVIGVLQPGRVTVLQLIHNWRGANCESSPSLPRAASSTASG